ncbi:MAG: protein-disulfide reductase DsbD family protein [Geminicoccaceae bacterium]
MSVSFRLLLLLLLLLAAVPVRAASLGGAGPFAETEHVAVELSADLEAAVPGESFRLGLKQTIEEDWHTYWRNPGDSGAETRLIWTLPDGVEAGPVRMPVPEAIPYFDLMNYGYEGEAFFISELSLAGDWPVGEPVEIGLVVEWLVCSDICIPGSAELFLSVPTSSGPPREHPINAYAFAQAEAGMPRPSPFQASFATIDDEKILIAVDGLPPTSRIDDVQFFAGAPGLVRHAAEQVFSVDGDRLLLTLEREPAAKLAENLEGLLVLSENPGDGAIRQGFSLVAEADPGLAASAPATGSTAGQKWQAVLFAFLGGLILNLMPCVFPVLSMKALSLVRHAGEPGAVRQGLAYTAGVLLSFLALAGALIALKATGAAIGWGFQLQSPPVIAFLACLMLAVGLWLAGAIRLAGDSGDRFQAGLMNTGSGLAQKHGLAGSFFTGVLAVLVATPCTAPFMAPALGFALTQNAAIALSIFAALGAGFALPFLLLSAVPGIARLLPKPGPWMERLKEALAFPMYATAAWLLWVLTQQTGPNGLLHALRRGVPRPCPLAFAFYRDLRPHPHSRSLRRDACPHPAALRIAGRGDNRQKIRAHRRNRPRRTLHPGPPRRAAQRRKARLRQHDGGLVHHLPRQRTDRPFISRRQTGARNEQNHLPQGRLDQRRPRNHELPRTLRPLRRARLRPLPRKREETPPPPANPHRIHGARSLRAGGVKERKEERASGGQRARPLQTR